MLFTEEESPFERRSRDLLRDLSLALIPSMTCSSRALDGLLLSRGDVSFVLVGVLDNESLDFDFDRLRPLDFDRLRQESLDFDFDRLLPLDFDRLRPPISTSTFVLLGCGC